MYICIYIHLYTYMYVYILNKAMPSKTKKPSVEGSTMNTNSALWTILL